MTSNFDFQGLAERIDERTADRLEMCQAIKLSGESYRKKRAIETASASGTAPWCLEAKLKRRDSTKQEDESTAGSTSGDETGMCGIQSIRNLNRRLFLPDAISGDPHAIERFAARREPLLR